VEFALISVVLFLVIFGALEMGRMVVVYTTLANAARVGARYAIVHGATNTGAGASGPNGPGSVAEIVAVVKDYAKGGLLNTNTLAVTVTYPDGGANGPGARVRVRAVYPYDPFTLLPIRVPIGSNS
jgi:Flp pilus assembly protein TadG